MTAITYHDKYPHRKLNEMILLGSHDAAIATGGSNAKTQTKSILRQANSGARFSICAWRRSKRVSWEAKSNSGRITMPPR